MIGKKVIHKTFGVGVITECENNNGHTYIKVDFSGHKGSEFGYPDSFETVLSVEDEDFRKQICKDLAERDARVKAEEEKKEQARLEAERKKQEELDRKSRPQSRRSQGNVAAPDDAIVSLTDEQIKESYEAQNISEELAERG